ncbi:HAMP domain-containing sensor histidine kinase, partial [Asanoa sp. NPDC050611]|uniref:sensor histidine kinase n=1 Tax=Asanoa sp. NPDC050611 TaxID=3157098 RepID=UPI0033EDA30D
MKRLTQSIRFRLTVLYSTLLFALAATALGITYVAVERATDPKPVTKQFEAELVKHGVRIGTLEVAEVDQIESAVNFGTLQTMRNYSLYALAGLFVASLGIGWVLSGRALRPVGAIARTTREIQATDLSRRIRLGGARDELRDLADTIDSMLDRLDDAFRAQRELIDDASHELRSPLAVIRANLDASLIEAPEATEAERARAVAVIDRAATRMTRLVEDLLATARRDAGGLVDTDLDLGAVAREAGEEYAAVAAASRVFLAYDVRPGLVHIGDHDALRRAVGNLLSNAVRLSPLHAMAGGTRSRGSGARPHAI